jgi:hypothetical protein
MEATEKRGLILKIAAGVFIGIMAALLVYSIPGWLRGHKEKQQEMKDVDYELWLKTSMGPEQLASRCGKVLKDQIFRDQSNATLDQREVTVEATDYFGKKGTVTARYENYSGTRESPVWRLEAFGSYEVVNDEDRRRMWANFPCLRDLSDPR